MVCEDRFDALVTVAGIDVAYGRRGGPARAAVVVLDRMTLALREQATVTVPVAFPYIPGLLSFREMPPALEALARLRRQPDLLVVDGHGLAHPRRFGIACHLGVHLNCPSIGVAKSRLVGTHDEPGPRRGDRVPLVDGAGATIGCVLRTRDRVTPVFVSIGHRVCLETAVALVLAMTTRYRLPEPTRLADRLSRAAPSASLSRDSNNSGNV